jgi:pimeloyl-ACP methyl ester carboxylesterase
MGAAELLQSLQMETRFCAVIAESAFSTFREVAYDRVGQPFHLGPWLGRTLLRPLIEVGFIYSRARYGIDLQQASPLTAVRETTVPVLLIHGLEDHNIPARHSEIIQDSNPNDVALWEVPGAAHTGAHKAYPQEFEQRLFKFLGEH